MGAPKRTGSFDRRLASARSKTDRAANTVPLNGLPQNHAAALTDRNGAERTYAATRFEGRQPQTNAVNTTAKTTCQATATVRHSFAIVIAPARIAAEEGICSLTEHEHCRPRSRWRPSELRLFSGRSAPPENISLGSAENPAHR